MQIAERSLEIIRGLLKRVGPTQTKKVLWDEEFLSGHWDFIDNTLGDCVYPYLEAYAKKGGILDLGCGPGNTANELAREAYETYMGVDISAAALEKARKRTEENGRGAQNRFEVGDFLSYEPTDSFDVILFRESMYHVRVGKVKGMLRHYERFLKEGGVFIVRMRIAQGKHRLHTMVEIIECEYEVAEKHVDGGSGAMVIVFRPRRRQRS